MTLHYYCCCEANQCTEPLCDCVFAGEQKLKLIVEGSATYNLSYNVEGNWDIETCSDPRCSKFGDEREYETEFFGYAEFELDMSNLEAVTDKDFDVECDIPITLIQQNGFFQKRYRKRSYSDGSTDFCLPTPCAEGTPAEFFTIAGGNASAVPQAYAKLMYFDENGDEGFSWLEPGTAPDQSIAFGQPGVCGASRSDFRNACIIKIEVNFLPIAGTSWQQETSSNVYCGFNCCDDPIVEDPDDQDGTVYDDWNPAGSAKFVRWFSVYNEYNSGNCAIEPVTVSMFQSGMTDLSAPVTLYNCPYPEWSGSSGTYFQTREHDFYNCYGFEDECVSGPDIREGMITAYSPCGNKQWTATAENTLDRPCPGDECPKGSSYFFQQESASEEGSVHLSIVS